MWAVGPPKGSKAKEYFQLSAAQEKVTDSLEEVVLGEEEREAARHRRPQRARRGC